MKKIAAILFLILILCLKSHGEDLVDFPYDSYEPLPNGLYNARSFDFTLKLSEKCHTLYSPLIPIMNDYLEAYSQNQSQVKLNKQHELIISYLKQTQLKDPACYKQVFSVYAVTAGMLSINGIHSYEFFIKRVNLLSAIQRLDLIETMTDEVREKYKKFEDKKIKGGYTCENKKIWLDPNLSIYNLGIILFHEINHLVGSIEYEKTIGSLFSQPPSEKEKFLLDESLTALQMAYHNQSFKMNPNRDSAQQVDRYTLWSRIRRLPKGIAVSFDGAGERMGFFRDKRHQSTHDANLIKSKTEKDKKEDNSLVSTKESFEYIWESGVKSQGVEKYWSFYDFFMSFNHSEIWTSILKRVNAVYAPESPELYQNIQKYITTLTRDQQKNILDPIDYYISGDAQFKVAARTTSNLMIQKLSSDLQSLQCYTDSPGEGMPGGEGAGLDDTSLRLSRSVRACHLDLEL